MDDLVAFLRARLDEVAERAQAAGGDEWSLQEHESDTVLIYDPQGEPVVYDEGWPTPAQARHILDHSPARVLAEVEAKRRVVDECAYWEAKVHQAAGDPTVIPYPALADRYEVARAVLRALGTAYADHPDYQPEWRP